MPENKFRQHPELVKGVRIQYAIEGYTAAATIHKRAGNFLMVKNVLKEKRRIRLSEVRGYWRPRVKASPKNMIPIN